jgi:hypothetical protein
MVAAKGCELVTLGGAVRACWVRRSTRWKRAYPKQDDCSNSQRLVYCPFSNWVLRECGFNEG